MATYPLTLACRNYDRTGPVLRGDVTVAGVELRPTEMSNPGEIFTGGRHPVIPS